MASIFLPSSAKPRLDPYLKITFRICRNMDNMGIQVPLFGI